MERARQGLNVALGLLGFALLAGGIYMIINPAYVAQQIQILPENTPAILKVINVAGASHIVQGLLHVGIEKSVSIVGSITTALGAASIALPRVLNRRPRRIS